MQRKSIISKTDDRLYWVDVARGLAMLCVIIGHMVGYENLDILIFSFHMPLFFLIAGYFQKKEKVIVFAKKKTRSLLVPYAFTCVCVIFLTQINNFAKIVLHREDAISARYLLVEWIKASLLGSGSRKDFLWIKSDIVIGAIWFLLSLFFAQIIVNLLIDKKSGLVCIVLIAVAGIVSSKFFWMPLSIQAGAAASVYVAVGYVYRNGRILKNKDLSWGGYGS